MVKSVCTVQATRKMQRRRIWHPRLLIIRMMSLFPSLALCFALTHALIRSYLLSLSRCVIIGIQMSVFFFFVSHLKWIENAHGIFSFFRWNHYKWMKTPFLAPWMHFNMVWNKHHLIVHPKWSAFEMRDIECFAVVCKCHWGCMEIFVLSVYFAVRCTFWVHCVTFVYVSVCNVHVNAVAKWREKKDGMAERKMQIVGDQETRR